MQVERSNSLPGDVSKNDQQQGYRQQGAGTSERGHDRARQSPLSIFCCKSHLVMRSVTQAVWLAPHPQINSLRYVVAPLLRVTFHTSTLAKPFTTEVTRNKISPHSNNALK